MCTIPYRDLPTAKRCIFRYIGEWFPSSEALSNL